MTCEDMRKMCIQIVKLIERKYLLGLRYQLDFEINECCLLADRSVILLA